jgi:uncharacterized protein YjbI with pentapeptide repeats
MRDRAGYQFDLFTQSFLKGRWDTPVGQAVRDEIIQGIKSSVEIRAILDPYVLEHPLNRDPYGHPYYPPDAIAADSFWVLTQDDLRGISFFGDDFSGGLSLGKKSLSYASFYGCNLHLVDLERTDLSYARFEECDLTEAWLVASGGFSIKFLASNLRGACFWESGFIDCDFSGSDLRGVYFESCLLEDLTVNYQTQFDQDLRAAWRSRKLPPAQRPDLFRAIRIAYERQQVWHLADRFFYQERIEQRKHITWPLAKQSKDLQSMALWLGDWLSAVVSGYGTKPFRVILVGVLLSVVFAGLYCLLGVPSPHENLGTEILQALYFSLTTFVTLGYGDITYNADHPFMRLLSTVEAWNGAIVLALFVTALARKVFR